MDVKKFSIIGKALPMLICTIWEHDRDNSFMLRMYISHIPLVAMLYFIIRWLKEKFEVNVDIVDKKTKLSPNAPYCLNFKFLIGAILLY